MSEDFDYEQIEPGVRDLVRLLRDAGFNTFSSCEGGPGHMKETPWVRCECDHDRFSYMRSKMAELLERNGYGGYDISQVYGYAWVCVETFLDIEFWSATLKPAGFKFFPDGVAVLGKSDEAEGEE